MKVRKPFLTAKNGFEPLDTGFVAHALFKGTVLDFDNFDKSFYIESFSLCSLNLTEETKYQFWRLKNVCKSSYL